MEIDILERIQNGLVEKRQNVTEFLETASEIERDICLCDDEQAQDDLREVGEAGASGAGGRRVT